MRRAPIYPSSSPRGACLLGACLLAACSSSIDPRVLEVDCSQNDPYTFQVLQAMEPDMMLTWFPFGDETPGATNTIALTPIPEGRCESSTALVLSTSGYTDWGAGFGDYQMPMMPADASEYEGVSFWARAGGYGTSTGFTLTINDRNTTAAGMVCVQPAATDVVEGDYMYNEGGMIVPVGGDLPSPQDCGNGFIRVVSLTRDWRLYTLPFESFQQEAEPNRNPAGIDRTGIYQFTFNIPKDSIIELWIDDLGLYRHRSDGEPAATQ
jgi:hypothetical protein